NRLSESSQTLRAVVRDFHAGDLLERTIRLDRIAHQLRGIPIDLVEIGAIWAYPAIARSASDSCVEPSGCAIARNLRACWIFRDGEPFAINAVAADITVTEIRRIYESVIRGDGEPAQFRRQARACVDLHERTNVDLAFSIDRCHGASVADGIANDKG